VAIFCTTGAALMANAMTIVFCILRSGLRCPRHHLHRAVGIESTNFGDRTRWRTQAARYSFSGRQFHHAASQPKKKQLTYKEH